MACSCTTGLGNSGVPNCMDEIMAYFVGHTIVPLTDNDGNENTITLATDTLNETFFTNKFAQSDASKRWFPINGLKDVTPETDDSSFKDYTDGSQSFLNTGNTKYTATLPVTQWAWAGEFEKARCTESGVYPHTADGKLVGYLSVDKTTVGPIPIDKGSVDWKPVFPVAGSNPQEIMISFNFKRSVDKSRIVTINPGANGIIDYDILTAKGLLNVDATISDIVATGYTVTLILKDFGRANGGIPVTGWVGTDFALYNNTSDASVTITTSNEGADGVYAHVIPAQTAADVLSLDSAATTGVYNKTQYELLDTEFAAV